MSHSASRLLMIFPLTLRLIRGVRVGCTLLCVSLMSFALQSQAEAIDVPVLAPEQLDNYQFPTQPDAGYTIEAL